MAAPLLKDKLKSLRNMWLLETNVGAPIVSSMEVNHLGETRSGIPVVLDRNACNADHIIVVNRLSRIQNFTERLRAA
jgi:hypothetical protein